MNPLFSVPRSPIHNFAQPKHNTAGVNVTGAGRDDPLEYVLDRDDEAVADFTGKVIQIHRMQLNDRDKARQMAENEREIARWLGVD